MLFENVALKVERRDRVALSGPNGAGKTTLLRAIAGETALQAGEIVLEKGARVALHDQRPPLERKLTLREYVLSGRGRPRRRSRRSCAGSSRRWRPATTTPRCSAATRAPRLASSTRAATTGATVRARSCAGSASPTPTSTGRSRRSPGGELTRASLARALVGRPRPAAARRADEPPRRREPRVARARARVARRRRDPRRARPLVPRGRHERRARARRRPLDLLPRAVARLAPGEGGARARRGQGGRPVRGRHRAARPLRRSASATRSRRRSRPRRS